jgi:hypothetical protein
MLSCDIAVLMYTLLLDKLVAETFNCFVSVTAH